MLYSKLKTTSSRGVPLFKSKSLLVKSNQFSLREIILRRTPIQVKIMVVNQIQLNKYVKLLSKGLIKRYDNNKESSGDRVIPSSSLGKGIVNDCEGRCMICGKKYMDALGGFDIHHIDGDRGRSTKNNLILLCKTCHGVITTKAKGELDSHINEIKQGERKPDKNIEAKIKTRAKTTKTGKVKAKAKPKRERTSSSTNYVENLDRAVIRHSQQIDRNLKRFSENIGI